MTYRWCFLEFASGSSMSLSCSSGHKVLESPFSQAQFYGGTEHPRSTGLKLGPGKRKGKTSKSKKTAHNSSASVSQTTVSSHKSKKKHSTKSFSASVTTKNHTHKTSTSSGSTVSSSLAQVDSTSPATSRKQLRTSRVNHHTSHTAVQVRTATTAESASADLAKTQASTKARYKPPESSSSEDKNKSQYLHPDNSEKEEKPSSTMTSLLTYPKMSTSALLLSMCDGVRGAKGVVSTVRSGSCNVTGGVAGGMANKRSHPRASLPPHMRVHRLVFQACGKPQKRGMGGAPEAGPLDLEKIGKALGRMQYRNVIVMSGAGISTSSGIPDFRTPGTGLYDNLKQYNVPDPTDIFDIAYFSRQPKAFFTLAQELYPGKYQPNVAHHFVRLLQDRNILLRNYTQNIDGLERIAGVQAGKLVEAHGSFASASCIQCGTKHNPTEVKAAIFAGKTPRCRHKHCYGLVKPDIVFFGEDLPARFYSLKFRDFAKCDLLIIMGTSLEVEPFASLATLSSITVPRVLLNRELVGPFKHRQKRPTDVARTGELGESLEELVRSAGWEEDLRALQGVEQEEESPVASQEEGTPEGGALQGEEKREEDTEAPASLQKEGRKVEDLKEQFSELTLKCGVEGNSNKKVEEKASLPNKDAKEGISDTKEDKECHSGGEHDNKVEDKGKGDTDDREGNHKHWRLQQPWKNKPD